MKIVYYAKGQRGMIDAARAERYWVCAISARSTKANARSGSSGGEASNTEHALYQLIRCSIVPTDETPLQWARVTDYSRGNVGTRAETRRSGGIWIENSLPRSFVADSKLRMPANEPRTSLVALGRAEEAYPSCWRLGGREWPGFTSHTVATEPITANPANAASDYYRVRFAMGSRA